MTQPTNLNCDKTQKLKWKQNSKIQRDQLLRKAMDFFFSENHVMRYFQYFLNADINIFNRPSVAGAVLQTPLLIIN